MIFTLAIGFIPASVIVFIVKERESKVKHQQLVSGVSLVAYWLSNYVVDYLKYVVFILAFFGLVQAFQVETMVNTANFQALVLLHFLNGFSMISFLYFFQFLFATYSSAQVVIFIIYNVCGTIFSIAILILRIIESTR
jgi:ATP-binding cassette subfamily A (ABC1) protein 3